MKRHPDLPLVLQTARDCHRVLATANVRHVIIGGLAVYLHGDDNRKPRDVDLLTRPVDTELIGKSLMSANYTWHDFRRAYVSPQGVRTEPHWDGKNTRKGTLHFPDPDTIEVVEIDGLPVIGLAPLIETKLQCELGSQSGASRDLKHRRDVLTLIRVHRLGKPYADRLDNPLQDLFCELVAVDSEPE